MLRPLAVVGQQTLNQHFFGEVCHRAVQGDYAVPHNGNVGGNLEHLGEPVGDVNDGDALFLQILHGLEQGLHLVEGQGAGRLVQNQNAGVSHHATQKLHQLLLGNGEGVGLALKIQIEVQLLHTLGKPLFQLALFFVEAHEDVLKNGHIGEQHWFLRHQIDALCQRSGGLSQLDGLAVDEHFTLVAGIDAHDNLHKRGFAGTVAANQCDNLAGINAQIDSFEHGVLTERLANPLDLEARGRCIISGHTLNTPVFLRFGMVSLLHNLSWSHCSIICAFCQ